MKSQAEVDRTVAVIEETRKTEYWRDHDCRPDGRAFRSKGRVAPEIVRAQTRLRTAKWRNRLDRDHQPTAEQIGMSLVAALVTSRLSELTYTDKDLVARCLTDLQSRGFSIEQVKKTLRRMRIRHLDPDDRTGEPTNPTEPALTFAGDKENDLPF